MHYTPATVQLLSTEGKIVTSDAAAEYLPYIEQLSDEQLRDFHRNMVVMRMIDVDAANLQRQGQLAMWIPSLGQEAAQVGSAFAARPQDHLFPAYREHAVARIRGVDPIKLIALLRGLSHGGWDPQLNGNFVWLPTGENTAEAAAVFASHSIVARALIDGLRVSVGEAEAVDSLLRASAEVVHMQRTSPTAGGLG